jgi:hypothetical protein
LGCRISGDKGISQQLIAITKLFGVRLAVGSLRHGETLLIVIEGRIRQAKKEEDSRSGFFLFGSFSFFKEGCGNVENPQADRL